MKSALRVLAFVCVIVSPVAAQAPFPGAVHVGDGWVPCDHPIAIAAGRSCTAPTPHAAPGLIDVSACVPERRPYQVAPPTFEVGQIYIDPCNTRILILGRARSSQLVEVITYEWLGPMRRLEVAACVNNGKLDAFSCAIHWRLAK